MESKWIYWCYNQDSILLHATQAIVSINTSLLDHLGVYSWHNFYFLSPAPFLTPTPYESSYLGFVHFPLFCKGYAP